MNIILIGFRGAGKSTLGQALAEKLAYDFHDCDQFIEARTGLPIAEIFERCGESYFRELESDALAELSKLDGVVIATGGGAVLRYKNIRNLKRGGKVVYLKVRPDTAVHRIQKDPKTKERRPKLTESDLDTEVRTVMEFREVYYQAAADLVLEMDTLEVTDAVNKILWGLGLERRGDGDSERPAYRR